LPDVFGRVEFWTGRRQRDEREIAWKFELARGVPAGLVENDQRMRAGRDRPADGVNVHLHGFGVGIGHDEGDAGVAAWTDRAEQIGVLIALVLRLAWPRSLLGPLIDQRVLLPD